MRSTTFRLAAGLVLICAFAACKKDEAASADGAKAPAAATKPVAPPAQAVAAQVAAMSADQLREAASTALREQRLYAPAANNAMEYYLALRDKQPNDPAVASALSDLMPYALIATEQSIARDDFVEAQRLYALMDKADAKAPALPRLKQSIADAQTTLAQRTAAAETETEEETKRKAELERERELEQQKAQQQAAQQLATQQATEQRATEQRAAEQRATEQRAAEQRAAEQRAAQQPTPQPAPTQPAAGRPAAAAGASSELRAISTPAPDYPRDALRDAQSGEVQVEFTVGTDGSVTSARVVRSSPPRVFDRAALAAVKRWRFQPVSAPVTSRRTIGFNPG